MNKTTTIALQVGFTVFVGITCYFYGVHQHSVSQGKSNLYKKEEKIKWDISVESLDFSFYFPSDEIKTILNAANRNKLTPEQTVILFAIRKAENGAPGKEFGIMHPKAWGTNLDTQAGWAAATVKKNYDRWIKDGKQIDFISFLGNRYCPVNAENDPNGLNKNWIKNVSFWVQKIKSQNRE